MKYIYIMVVLFLVSGCSHQNKNTLIGYDGSNFETEVRTTVQIKENEIYMVVRNPHKLDYQVWVVYKFKSKFRNNYTEERVHAGNEYQRNFIVTIPNDDDNKTRESAQIYVTSGEEYDIDRIIKLTESITIQGTTGGFLTINGLSVTKRIKYFQTPEIVLNKFTEEGSYGNSLQHNFNNGDGK